MTSRYRQLIVMVISFLVFFLFLCAQASGAFSNLKQGNRGSEVLVLQQRLQQLGYFYVEPTGYFGTITTSSVKKFQLNYGLKPDGIVGVHTNAQISKLLGLQNNSNSNKSSSKKEVLGFYTTAESPIPSSMAAVKAQSNLLTSVSPFFYRLNRNDPTSLELFGGQTGREVNELLGFSKQNNLGNYVLIHNLLYGSSTTSKNVVHQALADPQKRWKLVTNIFNLVNNQGYTGVTIDIENIYPDDRGLYVQFLKELSSQFQPAGLKIISCVPSRTTDKSMGVWGDNFNYTAIGQYADQLVVMAYDEHISGSDPGPIASKQYVEEIVKYSLTKLPPEKILLGVAGYGFDWNTGNGTSRYISYQMAMDTARQYNKQIQWDASRQVPYYGYTDKNGSRHSVYFENASSLAAKLDIVNNFNLAGIAIWRLGMEDPASWKVINDKFRW